MLRFDWNSICDTEFVKWIFQQAGIPPKSDPEPFKRKVVQLISMMGGPPIVEKEKTDQSLRDIAKGLLKDAISIAYPNTTKPIEATGYALSSKANNYLKNVIETMSIVNVNWCTLEELSNLPNITENLAKAIMEERGRSGPFSDGVNLATRVKGVGKQTIDHLDGCLDCSDNFGFKGDTAFDERLRALVVSTGLPPQIGLTKIIEGALTNCAKGQHSRWFETRMYDVDIPELPYSCEWIGILNGKEYFDWLKSAFADATKSIDIAMFHIAMGSKKDDPTNLLINELITASKRHVDVRVLMDSDRDKDPYLSTVINSKALKALLDAKVPAKHDDPDRLLHSKVVLLDRNIAVIGSHNWSSGSYLGYDDVSLAIRSDSLVSALSERFETMWNAASD